jgi:hypothetical protein
MRNPSVHIVVMKYTHRRLYTAYVHKVRDELAFESEIWSLSAGHRDQISLCVGQSLK